MSKKNIKNMYFEKCYNLIRLLDVRKELNKDLLDSMFNAKPLEMSFLKNI